LPGHTGRFIRVVFCTSLLFVLAHICFQTLLYTYPPLSIAIGDNCSQWDTISRHIGLSRLPLDDPWSVLRLLVPDLGVCVVALTTLVLCSRLVRNRETVAAANITSVRRVHARATKQCYQISSNHFCKYLMSSFFLPGITLPSAFSAIYFLLFIGVCTWWACHLPISHLGFNALCVMVGFFTAGHMVCLYVYQSLLVQALFPPRSLWARLFGLKDIIIPGNCSSPYDLNLNADHDWPVYVNPGILFLLYITIVTVLKTGCRETPNQPAGPRAHAVTARSIFFPFHCSSALRPALTSQINSLLASSFIVCVVSCIKVIVVLADASGPPSAPSGPPSAPSGPPSGPQQSESPFFLLGKVVMQQSYVCALIAMMVWSITYHSWLTFVLLLWACLIWMLRARRHAATLCSPFILLYGLALCCLQYVWAMELRPELPTTVGTMSLRQLGLDRAQHPCLRLGAMVRSDTIEYIWGAGEESVLKVLGGMVMGCWAKYWIYVCGGMFIMVSFAGKLVGYKIVYMLLFLICLCLYQVYYSLWRRLLKLFWWLVVAYTMLVLISIYTFQFEDFPGYWRNFTGFTEEQLAAVGLETFALSELFSSILIPGFFLLACILQLHYFHKPFMRITDLEHECHTVALQELTTQSASRNKPDGGTEPPVGLSREEGARGAGGDEESEDEAELLPSKWGLVMDRLLVLSSRFSDILTKVQVFLWRLLELHILKMVAFFSVWVSLQEPSVMNLVLVVLWSLAMPYSRFGHMASCLSTVWVCVIIVCKMLYQLSVVNPAEYSSNCSLPLTNETNLLPEEMMNSSLYEEPVDPAKWFGIRKDATALGYSKNHLIVLMLLVFEATVYRHQSHHYRQLQRSPPTIPALFPAATRDTLDQGLISCFKYLLNYTFYKFGLEICFLMTVNVIGQRMNFLVIIHGCWLVAILVRRRRAAIARIWPRYCLFLSIFMMYQYLLCVGIPPALCIDYPWRWNTPVLINSALVKWIFLPDFYTVPNSKNLIADFVLLMCASQQWKVFECEQTEDWMVLAGENTDDPEPMKGQPFNPAPNFINCRSYLDMAKVLVFRHLFWFVLSVVFITGATRISVFGLGYLLACFFFLLFGTRLLVKSSRTRLALWDCLIMYNVAVIVSKNMLSVMVLPTSKAVSDNTCSLPVEEAGIIWDSICFLCLLLQRRVFLSFYFLHVIAEMQASAQQASRGFELFRASIVKNIKFHQQAERKSLSQLKRSGGTCPHNLTLNNIILKPYFHVCSFCFSPQLAYLAWVTSVKTALKERQRHQRHLKSIERKEKEKEKQGRVDLQQEVFSAAGHGEMVQRILDILRFLWAIVLAMVDGLTQWLNLLTRQYRETSTVLCNERYFVVHKIKQVNPTLVHKYFKFRPSPSDWQHDTTGDFTEDQVSQGSESTTLETCLDETDETDSRHRLVWTPLLAQYVMRTLKHGHACAVFVHYRLKSHRLATNLQFFIKELEQSREFYKNQNRLLKLLFALHDLLAANSELVCYFIIVVNNGVSASVISLVLPILVFLWAMLAVPRPTKRFWMTAIVYTEVMVVVKYLFQFGFFPWNSVYEMTLNEDKPFFPPRILGLEKTDNYIRYDLLQLLALFFHRSLLMDNVDNVEPSTSSAAATTPANPTERAAAGSDVPQRASWLKGGSDSPRRRREGHVLGDNEQVVQEVPKKSSSIRFRHKLKKAKRPVSKGVWLPSLQAVSQTLSVYRPTRGFFMGILHAEHRAATDVYALMFLTDVVDFVIIVFGFWAFGKHSAAADIASTLSEDQVPEAFLVMLLIQFSTMIIDRALYLRKAVLGKLIFQVILVFGIHFWMFFILPAVTERKFNQNFVAQLWYFVKCIYFGLSAYQIRCAYPTRILGNFLTKKYNHLNLFLFQGFRMVPFLVELRAVMDWVWTDTTLSLSDWMCVEDIYANIFIIKCSRETEKKYPQPKGQKKKKIVKYGMGGLIIVFLICIIWFPLLFISLVRSVVGVVNHPIDVTVTVKLGGYESLFTMSVQQQSIQPFTQVEYDQLTGKFGDNVAMQFITLYSYEDIVTAMIEGSSGSVWRISPPSRQEVIKELLGSPVDLTVSSGGAFTWTHDVHACISQTVSRVFPRLIPNMLPNYIRAPNGAEAKPVTQLYKGNEDGYLNITLSLKNDGSLNGSANQEWWDIAIAGCASSSCGVLPIVIFNDKVSPPSLGFLAGYGIMGLYVSVVLVIGKFVRGFFSEISHSIMFEELPCVDRILKLCTDIFLVRETGELELEEELYSKLIFLYRSPETMIKWTRDMRSRDHAD
uniref:Piezo type mechanosensitive ion channel component 1 (Er blood group) n=1 Tax=Gasterosteus aculeatus aculeatus TaxID=481459 RepID=A0AAQ4R1U9_GASAC